MDRVCVECNSTETKMGEFKGYGALFKKKAVITNSPVDACFCLNCGYILFLKVRNPENFI
ncbi:hypothetical protein PGC35_21635 [Psychrobacillus sp. PGGUH221]